MSFANHPQPLIAVERIAGPLAAYLHSVGQVFRAFREQDSGCVSYGVAIEGERWFVKHAVEAGAAADLQRARALHTSFQHPALPPLRRALQAADGPALDYDWVDGEVLRPAGTVPRDRWPLVRFRPLPVAEILAALETIYNVHRRLAEREFVAVDFYDGCIIYDFSRRQLHLCDLDLYRPGPFVLEADRLPGSTRFMAPEEFRRGAVIDQVTNVFTLGKAAFILLGDGTTDLAVWRGSEAQRQVALHATRERRGDRYPSVAAFVRAWHAARR